MLFACQLNLQGRYLTNLRSSLNCIIALSLLLEISTVCWAGETGEVGNPCELMLADPSISEGLWSPIRVTEVLRELHRRKIKLSVTNVKGSSQVVTEVTKALVGASKDGASLVKAARRHHGSWDKSLYSAGMDPKLEQESQVFWTKEKVRIALRALADAGTPLNIHAFDGLPATTVITVLKPIFGKDITNYGLIHAVRRLYDSWDEGIKDAGLAPVRVTQAFWTRELITQGIKALFQAGRPLNSSTIQRDTTPESTAVLIAAIGQARTGQSLAATASNFFGSWDAALRAAGFDPAAIRLADEQQRWTKNHIREALLLLLANKVPLDPSLISNRLSEPLRSTLSQIGLKSSGRALVQATLRHFDSWDSALRDAGLNPNDHRQNRWARSSRLSILPNQGERVVTEDGVRHVRYVGRAEPSPDTHASENELLERIQSIAKDLPEDDRELLGEIVDTILETLDLLDADAIAAAIGERRGAVVPVATIQRILDRLTLIEDNNTP